MRNALRLTRYVALTAAVASLIGLGIGLRSVTAKEKPENDCLIALQDADGTDEVGEISCNDCDPACDADTDNSTPNGQCTFRLRAVLNVPTTGCTAAALKKAKVLPKKSGIVIAANGSSSVEGAFANVVVKLKGKKPRKSLVLKAIAVSSTKPKRNDLDKLKLTCLKQTAAVCPTTTTTTTLPPSCGDGTKNGTEECDPTATPTGCGASLVCVPSGAAACTCIDCTAPATASIIQFTTGTLVTTDCGGPGFDPVAQPPFAGSVIVHDSGTDTDSPRDLGAGCLYIGGGANPSSPGVPGGITPDGAASILDVSLSCANNDLVVAPHFDTGNALNRLSCTKGPGPGKSCINNVDSFPLTACTTDAQCGGTVGACVPAVNCFFGPPLPIRNGPTSTCVLNTFLADASGSINKVTGAAELSFPLASNVFVTGNSIDPCPRCQGSICVGGTRNGLACVAVGTQETSLECPPSGPYLPQFAVTLNPLATGTTFKDSPKFCSTTTAQACTTDGSCPTGETCEANGVFCPGQDTELTTTPGAFGTTGADSTKLATRIEVIGTASGDITDHLPHASRLASVFCIPATGNGLIDGSAFLPGPGAVTLPGSVEFLELP